MPSWNACEQGSGESLTGKAELTLPRDQQERYSDEQSSRKMILIPERPQCDSTRSQRQTEHRNLKQSKNASQDAPALRIGGRRGVDWRLPVRSDHAVGRRRAERLGLARAALVRHPGDAVLARRAEVLRVVAPAEQDGEQRADAAAAEAAQESVDPGRRGQWPSSPSGCEPPCCLI